MHDSLKRLTLIQQNDTHAQFGAHPELFRENGVDTYRTLGGYARAATVVRQIREQTAGAGCLLADCGDAIHGTAVAQWTKGAAVVPVLNAMGVDLMTPGNWEWGFGPEALRERVAEMKFPVLCCNVGRAARCEASLPRGRCGRAIIALRRCKMCRRGSLQKCKAVLSPYKFGHAFGAETNEGLSIA